MLAMSYSSDCLMGTSKVSMRAATALQAPLRWLLGSLVFLLLSSCYRTTSFFGTVELPCFEIEIHEESLVPVHFLIRIFSEGGVAAGYSGESAAVATLTPSLAEEICSGLETAIARSSSELLPVDEARARFGGLSFFVLRGRVRPGVSFSPINPRLDVLEGSGLIPRLRSLDRLLRRSLGEQYCWDRRCRVSRMEFP